MRCDLLELAQFDESRLSEILELNEADLRDREDSSASGLSELVLREKVHRSLHLIENSDEITTEELAEKLGFSSKDEFARQFKKNLLVEPDRYIFIVKNRHILNAFVQTRDHH